jgi:Bacterial Ig domain
MWLVNTIERPRRLARLLVAAVIGLSGCKAAPPAVQQPDPANEIPFGTVDTPVTGAQVPNSVMIGGWALDDRGIREVRLFVDGHFQHADPLNTDRPDVAKAFPAYAKTGIRLGWTTTVSFEAPGQHTVVAQAVDSDGATRDIGVLTLTSK